MLLPNDSVRYTFNVDNDLSNENWVPPLPPEKILPQVLSPDNPPWNALVALAVWVISILLIIFVPLIFLAPYMLSKGLNFYDSKAVNEFIFTDPTAIILQLAPIILAHILTVLVGWAAVTRFKRYSFFKMIGWQMDGFRVWHAVAITICFYALSILMTLIFGHVNNDFERLINNSRAAVYLVAIFATFTAPLVEELVYRGLLYSAFQRRFGMAVGVILVTLLFTLVHVPQYSLNGHPDMAAIVTLLLLSLTLTLIRAGTGNLLPCIVLHTIFNGVQSVLLILQPFLESPETTPDPTGLIHLLHHF